MCAYLSKSSVLSLASSTSNHFRSQGVRGGVLVNFVLQQYIYAHSTNLRPARITMANSDAASETAPSKATDAVLLHSDPIPDGAQKVHGIDFNAHRAADITVAELVAGMTNMGFQASAVADAVHIINQMVRQPWIQATQVQL